jgi:two-component system response regulator DesR
MPWRREAGRSILKETRIVLADDHPAILEALERQLESLPDLQVVAAVSQGADLESAVREHGPDLLILDLEMEPGFNPAEVMPRLQEIHPRLKVLVFSAHDEPGTVREMLQAGADGYAHKVEPMDALVRAIQTVAGGEFWLSKRLAEALVEGYWLTDQALPAHERAVLQGVADGETMPQIATQLAVAERTARRYLYDAMARLNACTRTAAVAEALRKGLIE